MRYFDVVVLIAAWDGVQPHRKVVCHDCAKSGEVKTLYNSYPCHVPEVMLWPVGYGDRVDPPRDHENCADCGKALEVYEGSYTPAASKLR